MHLSSGRAGVSPKRVTIPLKRHIGAPSQPVAKIGDRVERGDLIARIPEGKLGANVHVSISGRVEAVTDEYIVIGIMSLCRPEPVEGPKGVA